MFLFKRLREAQLFLTYFVVVVVDNDDDDDIVDV